VKKHDKKRKFRKAKNEHIFLLFSSFQTTLSSVVHFIHFKTDILLEGRCQDGLLVVPRQRPLLRIPMEILDSLAAAMPFSQRQQKTRQRQTQCTKRRAHIGLWYSSLCSVAAQTPPSNEAGSSYGGVIPCASISTQRASGSTPRRTPCRRSSGPKPTAIMACSEKGVRLAQNMEFGQCIPAGTQLQ
jgi:hypothetical protein